MPNQLPIMPFVILILLFLPIKLEQKSLLKLAFFLWLTGGLVLSLYGVLRLTEAHPDTTTIVLSAVAALAVGFAKGKFVLGKTSQRNIERIQAMTEPQKPIQVYSLRSWIIIGVMVGISLSLTFFQAPLFWRGVVNLGVGMALITSSLNYLKTCCGQTKTANSF